MISPKKQIAKILKEQPEDSSYEEILKELAFARMIEKGVMDSNKKKTISNDQMKRRIRSWQR